MSTVEPSVVDRKYELIEPIGSGGTARVWKAKHVIGNFVCAVKLMNISRTLFELCAEEFKLLSALHHPNIVRSFDMGYLDDQEVCYLSMEYICGKTWQDQVEVSPEKAMRWLEQMVGVLRYLHDPSIGVIHKDIKPANIVVAGDRAVLIDFNIAGRHAPNLGTPAYKCPLVEQGGQGWNRYADVWALAVSFYELITGHELFNEERVPTFLVALRPRPKIQVPKRVYECVCKIVSGEGQEIGPMAYAMLFGLPARNAVPRELPARVLEQFGVTSRTQQFLIRAMLEQERPERPRAKDALVRSALTRVGLPVSATELKRLRAVFSQLKGLGVVEYAGGNRGKVALTSTFRAAISEAVELGARA